MPLQRKPCCDLLSKVSLTIFTTVTYQTKTMIWRLWFAFKSFFDNIYNSTLWHSLQTYTVVICFQKFLWQYLQQYLHNKFHEEVGCDLLSKVSLTIFTTVTHYTNRQGYKLWFAFKSFFDNIYNSDLSGIDYAMHVVICFQKFLWQYLQQSRLYK